MSQVKSTKLNRLSIGFESKFEQQLSKQNECGYANTVTASSKHPQFDGGVTPQSPDAIVHMSSHLSISKEITPDSTVCQKRQC